MAQIDSRSELKRVGLRVTDARIAVMEYLKETNIPSDIQMIKKNLDSKLYVNTATIFRILNIFTEKGLTNKVSFNEGKFRYELSGGKNHHHLICSTCGVIQDFSKCLVPQMIKTIHVEKKFQVIRHDLEFYGFCESCSYKNSLVK